MKTREPLFFCANGMAPPRTRADPRVALRRIEERDFTARRPQSLVRWTWRRERARAGAVKKRN
ncbi:hypothetical protein [Caballeronia sp. Lep1P3]|uniref:hypothetical protein n=1 Tax=Caballeronia sp. Lep1P3 TaxID=2878150 RepID=UPI001FCFC121|nr:hypothetical protein [Caballeronia sp. Lep1P3]